MKSTSELIQEVEVNDKQGDFVEAVMYDLTAEGTKTAAMIGGIGSGKSVAMALLMLISKEELPQAKGQFACLTVTQFQRAIFPGVKSVWREHFDLREYDFKSGTGDYVLWRKPPEDWERPWQEPDNWDNCISFPNGWVMEVCGYKLNPDSHRGRNDDFAFMDEALLFKREWLKILEGRIRANVGKYDSPFHWLISVFSSPPYGSTGEWMFDVEEFQKEEPDRYLFMQVTTRDNAIFLPGNYIANLKKKLTKIEFDVEVLGKRLSKIPKSFYPALDWDRHTEIDEETFYDPTKDLVAVFDFNAHFTSCTVWQDFGEPQHCVMNAFVKEPDVDMTMAQTLAVELLDLLDHHQERRIVITGDRNGNNKSAGTKMKEDGTWVTNFEEVVDVFEQAGWEVVSAPLSYNPFKDEIQKLMHGILSETRDDGLHMRFHPVHAKSTVVSMQRTPITKDYKKDKSSETKKSEDQERATHLSDTVDYYAVWRCNGGHAWSASGFEVEFL
ncbi:hypothetical protein GCM10027275_50630 [Rhabdobacter roseus]|uniref:Terminase n=1 Tax=Rhabdobacter roseus TaxID=1655419 RepID=A0A840TS05_9BACT|nr:hypothetical protein [Rhabdobacter roseus]MBB5287136.1 hypothetical protein [Rhabdobacter roseus]